MKKVKDMRLILSTKNNSSLEVTFYFVGDESAVFEGISLEEVLEQIKMRYHMNRRGLATVEGKIIDFLEKFLRSNYKINAEF